MYGQLAEFFKNALAADRKVWITCSHCDRRTEAEIPDWTARSLFSDLDSATSEATPSVAVSGEARSA
jgi:hypothetical protein